MSTYPQPEDKASAGADRKPVTVRVLSEMRRTGKPIAMVTAYDYPSAQVVDAAGVDMVLVGDSGAMTVLGYPTTVPVSIDEMLMLTAAVRRGLRTPLLVGDLPFGSYEVSNEQAISTAMRFVKEGGCDVVKLEGAGESAERAKAIVRAGIPVMGHIGLTPQTATALGGFRAQGVTAEKARTVLGDALQLEAAGCFSIVFEAVPAKVTKAIMPYMDIPVIGIGAGPDTDGQVLVYHDLLGIFDGFKPKFAKRWADLRTSMIEALSEYTSEVRNRAFPGPEHCYAIKPAELEQFTAELAQTVSGAKLPSQSGLGTNSSEQDHGSLVQTIS